MGRDLTGYTFVTALLNPEATEKVQKAKKEYKKKYGTNLSYSRLLVIGAEHVLEKLGCGGDENAGKTLSS